MDQQYRVRNETICINCGMEKDRGLVVCWPCHSSQKRHNDGCYSKRLESKLAERERVLKASGAAEWRAE